jgi:hypothetical protein
MSQQSLDGEIENVSNDGKDRREINQAGEQVLDQLTFAWPVFDDDEGACDADQEPGGPQPPGDRQRAVHRVFESDTGGPERFIGNDICFQQGDRESEQKITRATARPNGCRRNTRCVSSAPKARTTRVITSGSVAAAIVRAGVLVIGPLLHALDVSSTGSGADRPDRKGASCYGAVAGRLLACPRWDLVGAVWRTGEWGASGVVDLPAQLGVSIARR